MKFDAMTRRVFLKGLSGMLLPLPPLLSLFPRELWGQEASSPIRAYIASLGVQYDYGIHENWFGSRATAINWTPENTMDPNGMHRIGYSSLTSLRDGNGHLSPIFRDHLNSVLNMTSIYRSLDFGLGSDHSQAIAIGNADSDGGGVQPGHQRHLPTIDSILNANSNFNPSGRRGIVLGDNTLSYQLDGTPRAADSQYIGQLYNQIFDGVAETTPGGPTPPAPQSHPRVDILSDILGDYQQIKNSRQISRADRQSLDNYLDILSDIHRGLASVTPPTQQPFACQHSGISRSGDTSHWSFDTNALNVLGDIIVASIMCGRQKTFIFGHDAPGDMRRIVSENGYALGVTGNRHDYHDGTSHTPFAMTMRAGQQVPGYQFMAEYWEHYTRYFVAPLAQKMDSVVDPSNGKSLLYNSLIHVGSHGSQIHRSPGVPTMLIGTANGKINSGYLVDFADKFSGTRNYYRGRNGDDDTGSQNNFSNNESAPNFHKDYRGVVYNRFYKTIFDAFDIPPSEYQQYAVRVVNPWQQSLGAPSTISSTEAPSGFYGHLGKYPVSNINEGLDLSQANRALPQPPTSLA